MRTLPSIFKAGLLIPLLIAAAASKQTQLALPEPTPTHIQAELTTPVKLPKAKVGDKLKAVTVTQVNLPNGPSIPAGSTVMGQVQNVRILREQNNGPALQVKHILSDNFVTQPAVERAYLVDVDYGSDHNTACVIQFAPAVSASEIEALIKRFMSAVAPVFEHITLSLDILPLSPSTVVPAGIKPFFDRVTRH